jgi:hypothetical protein
VRARRVQKKGGGGKSLIYIGLCLGVVILLYRLSILVSNGTG